MTKIKQKKHNTHNYKRLNIIPMTKKEKNIIPMTKKEKNTKYP